MHQLRRSVSVPCCPDPKIRERIQLLKHDPYLASDRSPSFDTLAVSQRMRYPSDPSQSLSLPTALDFGVAKALLDTKRNQSTESTNTLDSVSGSLQDHTFSDPLQNDGLPDLDPSHHRLANTNFESRASSASLLRCSRATSSIFHADGSSDINTEKNVLRYNELASRYGIQELRTIDESSPSHDFRESRQKRLWRYLSRSSTTTDQLEVKDRDLVRKRSVSDIIRKRSKLSLNCHSLDQMCRLGGISILSLPKMYTATELAIPSCLAATGNFLALHGPFTPGIFRIPGQAQAIDALYDHYVSQMRQTVLEGEDIQNYVGCALLPDAEVMYSVHDVASAFKKFLWDIPGGIVGSRALFGVLKQLSTFHLSANCTNTEWDLARPKLIALAIMSLRSRRRIALCSAVFGLLASIKADNSDARPDYGKSERRRGQKQGQEQMSTRALAVVFAPVLLGGLSQDMDVSSTPSGSRMPPSCVKRTFLSRLRSPKKLNKSDTGCTVGIERSIERSSVAAGVIEMLLRDWKRVTCYTRLLMEPSRSTSQSTTIRPSRRHTHAPKGRACSTLDPIASPRIAGAYNTSPKSFSLTQIHTQSDSVNGTFPARLPKQNTMLPHVTSSASLPSQYENLHLRTQTRNGSEYQGATIGHLEASNQLRWPSLHPETQSPAWWESPGRSPKIGHSTPRKVQQKRSILSQDSVLIQKGKSVRGQITPSQAKPIASETDLDNSCASSIKCETRELHGHLSETGIMESTTEPPELQQTVHDFKSDPERPNQSEQEMQEVCAGETACQSMPEAQSKEDLLELPRSDAFGDSKARNADILPDTTWKPCNASVLTTSPNLPSTAQCCHIDLKPMPGEMPADRQFLRAAMSSPLQSTASNCVSLDRLPWHVDSGANGKVTNSLKKFSTQDWSPEQPQCSRLNMSALASDLSEARRRSNQSLMKIHFHEQQLRLPSNSSDMEPPISRLIAFRPPKEDTRPPESGLAATDPFWDSPSKTKGTQKENVGTLYAEIRRLKIKLDARNEAILQLEHEMSAIRHAKDTATLSEKLREAERELRVWKNRAQWAEMTLFRRSKGRGTSMGGSE